MSRLFIDVTEFIGNPILTGIQRIVRKVLTHWPEHITYTLVRHDGNGLRTVDRRAAQFAIDLVSREQLDIVEALADIVRIEGASETSGVTLEPGDRLLAPELFYEHERVAFYRQAIRDGVVVHLVVPDFLVWLRPDVFPIPTTNQLMPYLQLLLETPRRAFISGAVKRTFESRIARSVPSEGDLALDLGADGLDIDRQDFDPSRKVLLCLGTLDGRKGQEAIYEAFCARRSADDLRLVFVGRVPPNVSPKLASLLANKRVDVTIVTDASDLVVASHMRAARATIYTSPAEGYGLPPMESLFAGIPVVVNANLPALEGKSRFGQIRLPSSDSETIRAAIESLVDDDVVRSLWAEASRFEHVTWADMTRTISDWASGRSDVTDQDRSDAVKVI